MAQVLLDETTPNGGDLDSNFAEVYGVANYFNTPGYTGTSWKVAIDASGRVVVGTIATPQVYANTQTPEFQVNRTTGSRAGFSRWTTDGNGPVVSWAKSRGAGVGTRGIVANNDIVGQLNFEGDDGATNYVAAYINASIDGTPGTAVMPGKLTFATTSVGGAAPTARLLIESSGNTSPGQDNNYSLGVSARRWTVVYAATGTINTSDARDKTTVSPMTASEIAAAKDLAREIGTYHFLDAVAAKGNAARRHAGMTVQRAIEIMRSHGLNPMAYGFICHDSWTETVEPAQIREEPTGMLDSGGAPIMRQVVVVPAKTIPAGDRYSFRPDELLMFIARGFDARLAALEAA